MSGFTCGHGEHYDLFGSGGGERLAEEIGAPLLAKIPIDAAVASGGDEGEPAALNGESQLGVIFGELAQRIDATRRTDKEMDSCTARMVDQLETSLINSPS
jgi:ATP-binding protein involved in chromosome partitioning